MHEVDPITPHTLPAPLWLRPAYIQGPGPRRLGPSSTERRRDCRGRGLLGGASACAGAGDGAGARASVRWHRHWHQHRRQAGDARREAFPDLGRFWATWYARRSEYALRRPDGTVFRVTSCSGWDQGDPFAPAGYSVGLAPALEAVPTRQQIAKSTTP